jgi:hypothetical protein
MFSVKSMFRSGRGIIFQYCINFQILTNFLICSGGVILIIKKVYICNSHISQRRWKALLITKCLFIPYLKKEKGFKLPYALSWNISTVLTVVFQSIMIIYGFTSRSRMFHIYGDVTIADEGLQNLGLCSTLRAFEQERSLLCNTCCDTGPRFFRSHPKDRPI